jgi:hypothetical protein
MKALLATLLATTTLITPARAETTGFTEVALPPGVHLEAVTTAGDDHAWFVGTGPAGPVVLHRTGDTWAQEPLPPLPERSWLRAISAAAPDDVWAVGGESDGAPLLLHSDGQAWSRSDPPDPAARIDSLNVVIATGGQAWALGSGTDRLHWDGTRWSAVGSSDYLLRTATASGPDDVWVGGHGTAGTGPTSYWYPTLTRWNGRTWTGVPVPGAPGPPMPRGSISSLSAASPTDVWMEWNQALHRWNGTAWSSVPPLPDKPWIDGVAASPGGPVWAWGTANRTSAIYRWTDGTWEKADVPAGIDATSTQLATTDTGHTTWALLNGSTGTHLLHSP